MAIAALSVWWVFITMGIATVTLPAHVVDRLGYGETELGIVAMAFGVATVLSRIAFARWLARHSAWRTQAVAALGYSACLAASALAGELWQLLALRLAAGACEGVFFVSASAAVARSVPPYRLGAALSAISVALFGGIAIGPFVGDLLVRHGPGLAWSVAAGMAVLAALLVLPASLRSAPPVERGPADSAPSPRGRTASAVALWAAIVMTLGTIGYGGFQSLLPLIAPELGLDGVGPVFAVYAVVSLVVRIALAAWVDRFDSFRVAALSAVLTCVGLGVMALHLSAGTVFAAAAVLAVSLGCQYPALQMLALAGRSHVEHPAVLAIYTASFDIGMALGALVMGVVTERLGFQLACLVAAVVCAGGILLQLGVLRGIPTGLRRNTAE